ncbi:MAG: PQQ-binding-like beta-propeller repeat protein [Planctomycetota bacterium]
MRRDSVTGFHLELKIGRLKFSRILVACLVYVAVAASVTISNGQQPQAEPFGAQSPVPQVEHRNGRFVLTMPGMTNDASSHLLQQHSAMTFKRGVPASSGSGSLEFLDSVFNGGNWQNTGANPQRNGLNDVPGATEDTLLWENDDDYSWVTWNPIIDDGKLFIVRQPNPNTGQPELLHAIDLETGVELWEIDISGVGWITWVGGASNGKVYVGHGGSGYSSQIYAYDAATGAWEWTSTYSMGEGIYTGITIAPGGDLLVGDRSSFARLSSDDGSTVWEVPRQGNSSESARLVVGDDCVYSLTMSGSQRHIARHDLSTGAFQYQSAGLFFGSSQNAMVVSPDLSRIYYPDYDTFRCFEDTGSAIVERWSMPTGLMALHDTAMGPDGSVYTLSLNNELVRLNPVDGSVIDNGPTIALDSVFNSTKIATTSEGNVYISNDSFSAGKVNAFSADLQTQLFEMDASSPNLGAPVTGPDRTLIVADRDSVRAFRSIAAPPETLSPTSYEVLGLEFGGNLGSLTTSDNSDLAVSRLPVSIRPIVAVRFFTNGANQNPDSLEFTFESSVFSRPDVDQTIEFFNFVSEDYETVDVRTASRLFDQTVVASASGNVSRFIQPGTGLLEARVSFEATVARAIFAANIDFVQWETE